MQAYPMVTPGCNKVGKCCVTTYNKTATADQVVSLTHLHKDFCRRYRSCASCLAWNNYNLHISIFFFKNKYILCSSCLGNLQMHVLSDNRSIILTGNHFSRWPGSQEKLILGSAHVHRQWLWSPIITWIASSVHLCSTHNTDSPWCYIPVKCLIIVLRLLNSVKEQIKVTK